MFKQTIQVRAVTCFLVELQGGIDSMVPFGDEIGFLVEPPGDASVPSLIVESFSQHIGLDPINTRGFGKTGLLFR
jgi:hypothetical protein